MDKQDDLQGKEGRCISCGFAGLRGGYGAERTYYEITKDERETKLQLFSVMVPTQGPNAFKSMGTKLTCIKAVVDLPTAMQARSKEEQASGEAWQRVFEEDRHCTEWWLYQPGHDPAWHLNDYDMQQLEQRRKDFELELFKLSQKVQQDSLAAARKNLRAAWIIGAIVIFLALLQVLEVWYFSTRPQQPIVIQMPDQQSGQETR
ncbi:MAG TPA: hypothetical protein VLR90_24605 [Blastocatellia bacterium]|nr:hypothetical protein [Blastocatellia bacterium]